MLEVKIECGCGCRYKFDVEPVNNRMPVHVKCPSCGMDGTEAANEFIKLYGGGAPVAPALATSGNTVITTLPPKPQTTISPPKSPVAPAHTSIRATAAATTTISPLAATRPLLERTTFFIREQVAMLKLTDTYDILDPATGQVIGMAKEEPPFWAKWLRLVIKKSTMPTTVNIYETGVPAPVLSIHRGFTLLRQKIRVVTGDRKSLGYFKSKLFSIGGGFNVFDNADQQVAEVKGNWKGWDFKFVNKNGREIGTVTKKWAGLGKELFTSADNYIISLNETAGARPAASALLLAAGLAIDIVYNEVE